MPNVVKTYVRYIDAANKKVGKFSMYLVYAMMGILLAQFFMAAYYLLGGGYSMILDGHVRMDLLYGRWSARRQALADVFTGLLLIFYMVYLFTGGISASKYALKYGQVNYTPWGPPLSPIKVIMTIGIFLMLLQVIATFFKDLAKARGKDLIKDKEETTT
jgi:TRAP-type mannitol/chloroaromatic compound transport system permease small subunit